MIGISRALVWLIVSAWIVVTTIIGLVRNAPIIELLYLVLAGALVLFIAGNIIASIGVSFVVSSILQIRNKRRKARLDEFDTMLAGNAEANSNTQTKSSESGGTSRAEGETNR